MADDKEGLAGFEEAYNPFTNPDTRPKSTLQFPVDPMAETVRGLPTRLMQNADENLTKNIVAYTPKPPESRYGSIRMPRMSDDPMNAGNFILAGPIAVEEALGRFAAKALPAKTIEIKLLQMGASKAELETRGVTQYLESQGTRPVHPLEVMKHLDDNPYQLNEIKRTDDVVPQIKYALAHADGVPFGKPFNTVEEAKTAARETFPARKDIQIVSRDVSEPTHPTAFSGWQTPGGENYREILMQAPQKSHPTTPRLIEIQNRGEQIEARLDELLRVRTAPQGFDDVQRAEYTSLIKEKKRLTDEGLKLTPVPFTGGHWQEPNVVAHMRVNDRTLPSGEKALHVEEWQSDWAIANRETAKHIEEGIPDRSTNFLTPHKPRLEPSHPLVDNWQDLMARRTIKEAVDGGYDRVTWTTGQQQADRYDLAAHVSALRYNPKDQSLEFLPVGNAARDEHDWQMFRERHNSPEELAGIIGKGPAEKLLAAKPNVDGDHIIDGLDLKVGGEWANKLYDESMVNRFNKFGKQYGVRVEDINISAPGKGYRVSFMDPVSGKLDETYHATKELAEAEKAETLRFYDHGEIQASSIKVEKAGPKIMHSIKVTPEMKESIGASRFHPFADLPGPKPKVAPTPPTTPAAAKKVDLHAEAAALDPSNPVRYIGEMGGYPMFEHGGTGVGSFIQRPGETVADAFARAKARYQK